MVYKKYKRLQIFNHLITQGMLNIELSYSQQSSSRNFFFRSIQIPCPPNEISLLRGTINGFNGCRSSRN